MTLWKRIVEGFKTQKKKRKKKNLQSTLRKVYLIIESLDLLKFKLLFDNENWIGPRFKFSSQVQSWPLSPIKILKINYTSISSLTIAVHLQSLPSHWTITNNLLISLSYTLSKLVVTSSRFNIKKTLHLFTLSFVSNCNFSPSWLICAIKLTHFIYPIAIDHS